MAESELGAQLKALLTQANAETVPSGVLVWHPEKRLPNGVDRVPSLSQNGWTAAYSMLDHGALVAGQVQSLASITAALRDVPQDGPVPLAIVRLEYARPRRSFLRAVDEAMRQGGALAEPPGKIQEVIKQRTAFMVSALLPAQWATAEPAARARVFQLRVDRRFYFSTPGLAEPDEMTVNDGNGEQQVVFGDLITCRVDPGETLQLQVNARYGQRWLHARCSLATSDAAAAPVPDEIWPLSVPGGLSGRGYVYRASGDGKDRRYWIMAEGFPGGYPASYSYDNLNQFGLADAARAAGYDLVTIGFDAGAMSVQANAEVVAECIRKANRDGENHVVGGVSMGGLTTRYALAAMECRELAHNTAVYLCIDTPHRGSRTSISNQWFAHFFEKAVPGMRDQVALLDSPANQQFLPQWYRDGRVVESELRRALYAEYEIMGGYPKLPRLYAVASGRGDGRQSMPAGTLLVEWHAQPLAAATLSALGDSGEEAVVGAGYWFLADGSVPERLAVASDVSWEGAAGSLDVYDMLVGDALDTLAMGTSHVRQPTACVVPTASALDIDQDPASPIPEPDRGLSPFDDYVCAQDNLPHIAITAPIKEWILEKLLQNISARGEQHG